MANINLLPWREELRETRNKAFYVVLAVVASLSLVGVFATVQFYSGAVSAQDARNNYLRKETKVLDAQISEIQALRETRNQLIERMELIQNLQGNRPVIVRVFDEVARAVPEELYFTEVNVSGNKVRVKGVAGSNNRVSALMRNFDQSDWFMNPSLLTVEAKGPGVNEFEVIMTRVDPKNTDGEQG